MEQQFLEKLLRNSLGKDYEIKAIKPLAGGCVNYAVKAECGNETFFIKWNKSGFAEMFESEARGLKLLMDVGQFSIPNVLACGADETCSYIILEYIDSGKRGKKYWTDFGHALSEMHKIAQPYYGLDFENYIGTLPQINLKSESWKTFFVERRLEPQIKMAKDAQLIDKKIVDDFNSLYNKIPYLINEGFPSLLHGDLWSGNVMITAEGKACLIDPAVYFGHREMEIAFTLLFGGFTEEFYNSYFENFPVESGFEQRSDIYNLYPLLVHVNLFGKGYLNQIVQVLKKYS